MRARELGLRIGLLEPGDEDAITDVAGRPRRPHHAHQRRRARWSSARARSGPASRSSSRTTDDPWTEPVFAGCHRLNGNGELTGPRVGPRVRACSAAPIGITNTHSVGVVRDALVAHAARAHAHDSDVLLGAAGRGRDVRRRCSTTSTGSTSRPSHVDEALAGRAAGPVAEGNVGGGTGMICHEFKGGIGTASRRDGRRGRRVHGRRARPGELRLAGAAADRRRAGRRGRSRRARSRPVGRRGARQRGQDRRRARRWAPLARARRRVDHRDPRDGRPAPPPPVRAARPAGRPRASRGWAASRRTGSGDIFLALRDRQPRPARDSATERDPRARRRRPDARRQGDRRRCSRPPSRRPRRRSSTRSSRPRR